MVQYGLVAVEGGAIDLLSVSVEARVVGFGAEVNIIQIYVSSGQPCEAVGQLVQLVNVEIMLGFPDLVPR